MNRLAWTVAAFMLMGASIAAHAQDGYVTVNLNMRAAPDIDYPLVTTIPAGTPVSVQGCIDDYQWCDVIAYNDRGWVAGDYIDFDYRGRRVPVIGYGAQIGIPIISFVIGDYWGRHYSHRSFYRQRNNWYHRPIHYRSAAHHGGGHNRGRDHRGYDGRGRGRDNGRDHGRDRHDGRHNGRDHRNDHSGSHAATPRRGHSNPRVNHASPARPSNVHRSAPTPAAKSGMPSRAARTHARPETHARPSRPANNRAHDAKRSEPSRKSNDRGKHKSRDRDHDDHRH